MTAGRNAVCLLSVRVHRIRKSPAVAGFTLIEILVVLAIVAIMLLAVGLSVNSGGASRRLGEEAHRLLALVELSCDQAALLGQDAGVEFRSGGYRFLRARGREWEAQPSDTLRPRVLPDGMLLALNVDGRSVDLEADVDADAALEDPSRAPTSQRSKPALRPQLACDSEGNLSAPIELTLQAGESEVVIAQNEAGALAVVAPASP